MTLRSSSRSGLLVVILTLASSGDLRHAQTQWPTIAEIVKKLGTDTTGLPPVLLSRRLTSYDTLAQDGEFAFAGYEDDGTGRLNLPLHVGMRERESPWRIAQFSEGALEDRVGSVTKMWRLARLLIVNLHVTPSASETLVLRSDLTILGRLKGWFLLAVPDGVVVFQRSIVHFAPAHTGELATFEPATGVEAQLYPTDKTTRLREAFIKRLRPIYERWQKLEPDYVYGFDPESFDESFGGLRYDAGTDVLTVPVTFSAARHPEAIAPPQSLALTVRCQPMRSPLRACSEALSR